jgi:hypothetical protein
MDIVPLSRIRSGMTTAFHIVFSALIICLLFPIAENERGQEGGALILPVAPGYIFYSYRVFHGKIVYGESYE